MRRCNASLIGYFSFAFVKIVALIRADRWREFWPIGRRRPCRPRLYQMLVATSERWILRSTGTLSRTLLRGLAVPDSFLSGIIADLSSEDSPYLFNTLSVDIIGSVYERFIGKTIHIRTGARPRVDVELKPEVRKAGGVYYTPQYIVNYIVEKSLGLFSRQVSKGDRQN